MIADKLQITYIIYIGYYFLSSLKTAYYRICESANCGVVDMYSTLCNEEEVKFNFCHVLYDVWDFI